MESEKLFDYCNSFNDVRLNGRCEKIVHDIFRRRSAVINQFCENNSETTAARRFFHNSEVSITDQLCALTKNVGHLGDVKRVLLIEDGTEFNFTSKSGRIRRESLGPLTNKDCVGFFFHPCLVVDAQKFNPLGCSAIEMWKRKINGENKNQRKYKNLPIEKKESWNWIKCIKKSKEVLPDGVEKIVVADREADIYQLYCQLKDDKTDLVIRLRSDRNIKNGTTVRDYLKKQSVKKIITMNVKADEKDNRSKHVAVLELKYGLIEIIKPQRIRRKDGPSFMKMSVVEIKESKTTVQRGESPVHWILLTTIPVTSEKKAETILEYYSKRWMIEEIFGIMKSRSLNLEKSQLSEGKALMKLAIVAMDVAVKILQLTKGREDEKSKAEMIFSKTEIELIEKIIPEYEGKTEKQKNPFRKESLAWAAWLIGRLGGWKGYKTEAPPGNRTMGRGLKSFYTMFSLYKILKEKDVYGD